MNEDYEYLVAESPHKGDPEIERKMRAAAKSFGVHDGRPVWMQGRKITHEEWEVQMERLLEGLIPDERDASEANIEEAYLEKKNLPKQE